MFDRGQRLRRNELMLGEGCLINNEASFLRKRYTNM